jgi:hypothetical protein
VGCQDEYRSITSRESLCMPEIKVILVVHGKSTRTCIFEIDDEAFGVIAISKRVSSKQVPDNASMPESQGTT